MDAFVDLVRILRPKATLWGRTDGAGRWSVSFRKRDDLLFCWMERGECQLARPEFAPIHLEPDDFILIRSTTPFALTTDPSLEPVDSETLVASTGNPAMKLGSGATDPVTLHGGKFVFDTANEDLLMGMLPQVVHIKATDEASWRVRSLLKLNATESMKPAVGNQFVIVRLMELILFEILRGQAFGVNPEQSGLLAGMADPIAAKALASMHGDVAQDWTVSDLARICGVSRSTLAGRFRRTVGTGPIEYLQRWRMAVAKDELRLGARNVGEIAMRVGFLSTSAFSTAFSKAVGCSPKRYVASVSAVQERVEGS